LASVAAGVGLLTGEVAAGELLAGGLVVADPAE
jgi:hypothetical protein